MSVAMFQSTDDGKVVMLLRAPIPDLLTLAVDATADHTTTPLHGTGPLATVSDQLASDPLAGLEAQMVADSLVETLDATRAEQDDLAARLLAAANRSGAMAKLDVDQLLVLSGWANRLYLACRAMSDGGIQIGQGEDVLSDDDLSALLGQDSSDTAQDAQVEDGDGSDELDLLDVAAIVAAQLAIETAQAHMALTTTRA